MRLAVLSDVHANLPALRAVLADAAACDVQALLCLGDIVGYNTDPEDCIALLRARGAVCVAGNHDLAVAGRLGLERFGLHAARAIAWTRARLGAEATAFLAALPRAVVIEGRLVAVHGALLPEGGCPTTRIEDASDQLRCLAALAAHPSGARLCVHGHTHRAGAVLLRGGVLQAQQPGHVALGGDGYWLLNPGSVGQPRAGEPGGRWLLLDLAAGVAEFRRVRCPVWRPRARSWRAGLTPRSAILPGPLALVARRMARRLRWPRPADHPAAP